MNNKFIELFKKAGMGEQKITPKNVGDTIQQRIEKIIVFPPIIDHNAKRLCVGTAFWCYDNDIMVDVVKINKPIPDSINEDIMVWIKTNMLELDSHTVYYKSTYQYTDDVNDSIMIGFLVYNKTQLDTDYITHL